MKPRPSRSRHITVPLSRYGWYSIFFVLVLYVLLRQFGTLHLSLGVLGGVRWRFVGLAVGATLVSHAVAAAKYQLLALKRVRYWPTLVVQLAALLTSRLLPAGLGGLGVNYLYLRRHRHTAAQAAVVVSVNNVLGVAGNCLLVIGVVFVSRKGWSGIFPRLSWHPVWLAAAAALLAAAALVLLYDRRLQRGIRLVLRNLLTYRHRPEQLSAAVACSVVIALCYSLALWWSAQALSTSLPFITALIVMTVGVAAGSTTPTPGGLGGAEAGLIAGLSAAGLQVDRAVAVALLYRLISFWLSLLIGGIALATGRRSMLSA